MVGALDVRVPRRPGQKDGDETLLHETGLAVVDAQRRYGKQNGVPWGMSESLFNLMDLPDVYQYRAFGAPGLGPKRTRGRPVVAPYATALATMVRPDWAVENLRTLEAEGALGRFDSSKDRLHAGVCRPANETSSKAFMSTGNDPGRVGQCA